MIIRILLESRPIDISISHQNIWLILIVCIVLDILLPQVPLMAGLVVSALFLRPHWLKEFVDQLYRS